MLNSSNKDYTNETFIENLPYGHIYKFRVSILDNNKVFYNSSESDEVNLSLSKYLSLE